MQTQFDVIVVGAGPAGSALAALLGRNHARVLLLDRATFPRQKLCGEYMSPGALGTLDRLGVLEAVEALPHRKLLGHEVHSYDGSVMRGRYVNVGPHCPPRPYGLAVRRSQMDEVLFRHACSFPTVTAIEGFRVDALLHEGGAVSGVRGEGPAGRFEFRARLVAGCDGVNSSVARDLGFSCLDRRLRKVALVGYWNGMETGDFGEAHLTKAGYFALAGIDSSTANINFIVDGASLKGAHGDLDAFYESHVRANPSLAPRLRNAVRVGPVRATGPMARRNLGCTAPGAILCGDAAEFVDPVTGEGIFIALRSAEIAAPLILEALRTPGEALHLAAWPAAREAEFGERLRACWRVQAFLPHRWTVNAIVRRLGARPDLADRIISMSGDYVPPDSVFNMRFILSFLNPFARATPLELTTVQTAPEPELMSGGRPG